MNYLILNDESIVIGISQLSGEVSNSNYIKINEYDVSLLGKKYTNGEFIDLENKHNEEEKIYEQELKQLEFEEKIEYLTTLLEIQGGLINV